MKFVRVQRAGVSITCQTKGSYDYGTYDLSKSEVDQVIRFLQKWKSNH